MANLPFFKRLNSDPNAGRRTYADSRTAGQQNPTIPNFTQGVNFDRVSARDEFAIASGAVILGHPFIIAAGDSFNQMGVYSGAQAAVTPTHQWGGIIQISTNKVLTVTTDMTTAAWAANAQKAFTMSGRYTNTNQDDIAVWPFICVVAATPPSIIGAIVKAPINLAPFLGGTGPTGQVGPLANGATIAAPTASVNSFWCWTAP